MPVCRGGARPALSAQAASAITKNRNSAATFHSTASRPIPLVQRLLQLAPILPNECRQYQVLAILPTKSETPRHKQPGRFGEGFRFSPSLENNLRSELHVERFTRPKPRRAIEVTNGVTDHAAASDAPRAAG